MSQAPITWEADAELSALLYRYYRGEGDLWPAIQAHVHRDLQRQGRPVAPRHLRFRATPTGYLVIIEDAEGFATP